MEEPMKHVLKTIIRLTLLALACALGMGGDAYGVIVDAIILQNEAWQSIVLLGDLHYGSDEENRQSQAQMLKLIAECAEQHGSSSVLFLAEDPAILDKEECEAVVEEEKNRNKKIAIQGAMEESVELCRSLTGIHAQSVEHRQVLERAVAWGRGINQVVASLLASSDPDVQLALICRKCPSIANICIEPMRTCHHLARATGNEQVDAYLDTKSKEALAALAPLRNALQESQPEHTFFRFLLEIEDPLRRMLFSQKIEETIKKLPFVEMAVIREIATAHPEARPAVVFVAAGQAHTSRLADTLRELGYQTKYQTPDREGHLQDFVQYNREVQSGNPVTHVNFDDILRGQLPPPPPRIPHHRQILLHLAQSRAGIFAELREVMRRILGPAPVAN